MKFDRNAMLLYAVTDRAWLGEKSLAQQVELAIQGGATFVQLREKQIAFAQFVQIARQVKQVTDRYRVPFVINDNIDVALAVDADGVHVGQSDMAAQDVRKLIGPDKILGVSANTPELAQKAQQAGADYIGAGAVFATSTKLDAGSLSKEQLQKICASVSIPVVAIGGISAQNMLQLKGSGIAGIAVVSALFAQEDIYAAAKKMHALAQELVENAGSNF